MGCSAVIEFNEFSNLLRHLILTREDSLLSSSVVEFLRTNSEGIERFFCDGA